MENQENTKQREMIKPETDEGRREEGKRGKEKRKVGKSAKVKKFGRERSHSLLIADWLKRGEKRKRRKEDRKEEEGKDTFKRSSKGGGKENKGKGKRKREQSLRQDGDDREGS